LVESADASSLTTEDDASSGVAGEVSLAELVDESSWSIDSLGSLTSASSCAGVSTEAGADSGVTDTVGSGIAGVELVVGASLDASLTESIVAAGS